MTLTLNSFGVTTFYYSDSAYICPQGVTGQIITEVSKKETITPKSIFAENDIIPKGQPLIITGTPNTTYEFVPIDSDVPIVKTILRGTNEKQFFPGLENYRHLYYVALIVVDGKAVWSKYQEAWYNDAHKCFFIYNKNEKYSDQKSAGLIEGMNYVPIA